MLAAPAGNDIMYDDKLVEQGRNFCNKIWNSFRLLKGWNIDHNIEQPQINTLAAKWFNSTLNAAIAEIDEDFAKFRINDALKVVYRLFRDDFSSWYLELIKPAYGSPIDGKTYHEACGFLDKLLRLLHPFMPFITEELWQHLEQRAQGQSIMYASMPDAETIDGALLEEMEIAKDIVAEIRAIRVRKNIPQREQIKLLVLGTINDIASQVVYKLGGVEEIVCNATKDPAASSFLVGTLEFNIPQSQNLDVQAEKARIQKEIDYLEGFKKSVEKKLGNERFVANAPEAVVNAERKKLSDADSKLDTLRQSLAALN